MLSIHFCYFTIIYPWKGTQPFIWTSLNSRNQRMSFAKICWNQPSVIEKILKICQSIFVYICLWFSFSISLSSPLGKESVPSFERIELNPLLPWMVCANSAKFVLNWSTVSGDLWILPFYFHYFVITSSWKRMWPFIWTNLNPKDALFQVNWNWPSGSWEEDENINSL